MGECSFHPVTGTGLAGCELRRPAPAAVPKGACGALCTRSPCPGKQTSSSGWPSLLVLAPVFPLGKLTCREAEVVRPAVAPDPRLPVCKLALLPACSSSLCHSEVGGLSVQADKGPLLGVPTVRLGRRGGTWNRAYRKVFLKPQIGMRGDVILDASSIRS